MVAFSYATHVVLLGKHEGGLVGRMHRSRVTAARIEKGAVVLIVPLFSFKYDAHTHTHTHTHTHRHTHMISRVHIHFRKDL